MSNYPGNSALAAAVKERVASTFEQTVALYRQGRKAEVIAGCNLILQMDPMFEPAKKLLQQAGGGAAPPADPFPTGDSGASLAEAKTAMASRDFERVLALTTEILTNDLMNDEARVLADEAREKIEAAPFIDQFVRKCETALNNGNLPAARTELEKARALDASHPGVKKIEQAIAAKESAAAPSSFDASSFVVDTPAAGSRGSTQATDFGFTFEEDKSGGSQQQQPSFANFSFDTPAAAPSGGFSGFSFDSPAAAPAAPAAPAAAPSTGAHEFDFSTASIETTPDDQKKVEQYLTEGDREFEAGHYQQAIDLWSRIFLIDVTNDAASERIERAKAKRREAEQKIEGIIAAGVQAFEKKDLNTARSKFNEALAIDPGNVTAQDYIERLDQPASATAATPSFATPSTLDTSFLDEPATSGSYEAAPIPEPAAAPPRKASSKAPAKAAAPSRSLPVGLIAAVVAVVVLAAGGWFAWSKFMSQPKTSPAATKALLDRATELSTAGKYDLAIATLQDIKPGDPQYDKALSMIDDIQRKKTRSSQTFDGRPAQVFFQENINAGRAAFETHDYLSAKKAWDQALRVKPLPADVKPSYDIASQQVTKLDSARTLFAERKYQDVITTLQPLLQQDPQNKNMQRMIIDAHFDLGASALQDERLDDAKREFDEVLKSDPNDELAKRSRDLAERYDNQPKDLLYKIYVKYLPLRQPSA